MTRPLRKRNLIGELAGGLSFVDVGGLWGTHGETVTTAALAGASRTAMADIQPPGSMWWKRFDAHCAERGVSGYEKLHVDICAPDAPSALGQWDFVHCAGVMYHVADLFQFVGNLVASTRRYLMLSSVTMPEQVTGPAGTVEFGPDQAYLAATLTPERREIIGGYLAERGLQAEGINAPATYIEDGQPQTIPWWWLFSGEFLTRMVGVYGLEVVAEGPTPRGNGHTVLARVPEGATPAGAGDGQANRGQGSDDWDHRAPTPQAPAG